MATMYATQQEIIVALRSIGESIWLTFWNAVRQHGANGAAAMVGRSPADLLHVSGADDQ